MTLDSCILAATDLSAPARHAAERAALLSKSSGAALHLLHVANLSLLERLAQLAGVTSGDMKQRILATAQGKLDELVNELRQRFDIVAQPHSVAGALLAELTRMTESVSAGLLVCGAKGESFLRHYALGTTALRMLSIARQPVLVVKQVPHAPYRKLLVPVDFSDSSLRAIDDAQRIAPQAHIVLLHVFEVPFEGQLRYANVDEDKINHYRVLARQEATEKINALRAQSTLSASRSSIMVLRGSPTLRITEQEQELDCDLIVIGKHGESLVDEWLLGSVTKHVLAESQGDVLVSV